MTTELPASALHRLRIRLNHNDGKHLVPFNNGCVRYVNPDDHDEPSPVKAMFALKHKRMPAYPIRHSCGQKDCINPDHFIERPWNSSITEADVVEIRRLAAESELSYKEIGAKFGLGRLQVGNIVHGRSFGHVPGAMPENHRRTVKYRAGKDEQLFTAIEIARRWDLPIHIVHQRLRAGDRGARLTRAKYAR